MIPKIQSSMMVVCFILISAGLFAQSTIKKEKTKPRVPAWVSDRGYWVVETNIHSPKNHVVSFYTNDNILMYRETLEGVKLNPEKRSVKMKLKKTLESSVISWYRQKPIQAGYEENQAFVKAALKWTCLFSKINPFLVAGGGFAFGDFRRPKAAFWRR